MTKGAGNDISLLSLQDVLRWQCHTYSSALPKPHFTLPSSLGIAVALQQAMTPEFKAYQQQVVANCQALSSALMELGYDIVTGEDRSWQQDGSDSCILPGV